MALDHVSSSSGDDESSELPVAIGDVLDGKYRIVRVLGKGGMGVVIAAVHVELGHRVALKFLSREGVRNEENLVRFALEAKAAALMRSEHATRILDIGRLPSGEPFMVLEMLEGSDLGALMARHGPLPVLDAVTYVLEACEAIAEAHALGIVHRDLKPDNLFLATRPDGTQIVKVLDFGISKFSSFHDQNLGPMPVLTTTSAIIGSPMYMSPEQLKSTRDVDHRTDIWSIGVALYELLSGQPPFPWKSMAELSAAILKDEPAPLTPRVPDVSLDLERVILRCLEKNPDARFDNIAELAWALAPFGRPRAVVSAERASELLARGRKLQNARDDQKNELAKRQERETQSAETNAASSKIIALPLGASRPAHETATTRDASAWSAVPSFFRRGLPIAAIFGCVLLAMSSNRAQHPGPKTSTNLLEARRGIAQIAIHASMAQVLPKSSNTSAPDRAVQELPPSKSSASPSNSAAPRAPGAVPRVNTTRGSARVSRGNPFADRE